MPTPPEPLDIPAPPADSDAVGQEARWGIILQPSADTKQNTTDQTTKPTPPSLPEVNISGADDDEMARARHIRTPEAFYREALGLPPIEISGEAVLRASDAPTGASTGAKDANLGSKSPCDSTSRAKKAVHNCPEPPPVFRPKRYELMPTGRQFSPQAKPQDAPAKRR